MERVAVITGASQGLGLALARRLAADGWALAIDARRADGLSTAADGLSQITHVAAVPGDIAEVAHRAELASAARGLGEVRLVVNNASTLGASPQPTLDTLDAETFGRILAVNVIAPLALVSELAGDLGPGATIVNITSDASVSAYAGWGGYGSSKAALDHASRVLAEENPQWRVFSVDPGDMRTEMHQAAFPGEDISDRPEPEDSAAGIIQLIGGDRPSGRYLAKDVA